MSQRRTLTVVQLSSLRRLADGLSRDADHTATVMLVAQTVREYHARGTTFDELARALAIDGITLREMLDQHPPTPRRAPRPSVLDVPWMPRRSAGIRAGTVILACSGDHRPRSNDLGAELATVRAHAEPRLSVVERSMIEIAELPHYLNQCRPTLLHLAAHSEHSAIFLTGGGQPVSITYEHLARAILSARHRPDIVVLNFCRSIMLVPHLNSAISTLICWPDLADDRQCLELVNIIYRHLGAGRSIGDSIDAARITLTRHSALGLPQLIGETRTQFNSSPRPDSHEG